MLTLERLCTHGWVTRDKRELYNDEFLHLSWSSCGTNYLHRRYRLSPPFDHITFWAKKKKIRKLIISDVKWRVSRRGDKTYRSGMKCKMRSNKKLRSLVECIVTDLQLCSLYVGYCILCCLLFALCLLLCSNYSFYVFLIFVLCLYVLISILCFLLSFTPCTVSSKQRIYIH